MTATLEASYQPLQPFGVDMGEGDETPQESGVMIHVVPESGRARWNHVEDLDAFFTRMYHYHQKHGFYCMMLQETLELGQFVFVAGFSTFLFYCVDYPVLFKDKIPVHAQNSTKISLSDAIVSGGVCVSRFTPITWICLIVSVVFWLLRVIKVAYHLLQFLDIKAFFNTALKINDSELDNLTWHEVQSRVREVQREQQMCIHKQDLTELDIYHRILRFKNYMVAMVNKSVLPVRIRLPFIGEVVFLSRGLKYNIELLLFWGPWAPFENSWHLKEEYKKFGRRQDLAQQLEKHILWVGIANLLLCPLILLWQILYSFFNYAEVIKREPGSLGSRRWSLYGRLYLRHLNELEHELNARLNRAYRPASKYMGSFASPLMTVIAKNIAFIAGACLAVLLILTVYDEDVLTVEHLFSIMTVLGGVVAGSRAFIPDENMVWCPEKLMTAVLAHAHYFPDHWRGQAHTNRVRQEFSQLFQYKAVYLLEELLSPVITPFVLCFLFRPKALEIVDFYRNFTVEVVGVGDVCSFAQMDVRRHGSPTWQGVGGGEEEVAPEEPTQYAQAEDGKTELSLVHFTLTNPNWSPPTLGARNFVSALRDRVLREAGQLRQQCPETAAQANVLTTSLSSLSSIGIGLNSLVTSALRHNLAHPDVSLGPPSIQPLFGTLPQTPQPVAQQATTLTTSMLSSAAHRGGLSRAEGPLNSDRGLLYSIHQGLLGTSMGASVFGPLTYGSSGTIDDVLRLQPPIASTTASGDPSELTAADMSLSTLYLHEVHHRLVQRRGFQESSYTDWRLQHHGGSESSHQAERTPLLDPSLRPPP